MRKMIWATFPYFIKAIEELIVKGDGSCGGLAADGSLKFLSGNSWWCAGKTASGIMRLRDSTKTSTV